jgi:hypothetical protein
MSRYIPVPGHPGLRVGIRSCSPDDSYIGWIGSADDLIAAGIVTAERLLPLPGGKRRRDEFSVDRGYTVRGGVVIPKLTVFRRQPLAALQHLPGVAEALARERAMWPGEATPEPTPPRPRPHLRLVVSH